MITQTKREVERLLTKHFGDEKHLCLIKMYLSQPKEQCRHVYSEQTLKTFVEKCRAMGLSGNVEPKFDRVYDLVHERMRGAFPRFVKAVMNDVLKTLHPMERAQYKPDYLVDLANKPFASWIV